MKVGVGFSDVEFGAYESRVDVVGKDGRTYISALVPFWIDGVRRSILVVDEGILGNQICYPASLTPTMYAQPNDGMYWIIERFIEGSGESDGEIEFVRLGNNTERVEMEKVIEIPADAKTVTLEMKKNETLTLRAILPKIVHSVELVMKDVFETSSTREVDLYRLKAVSGSDLMKKLDRSRVVEGKFILDLVPTIDADTDVIRLVVSSPMPDGED